MFTRSCKLTITEILLNKMTWKLDWTAHKWCVNDRKQLSKPDIIIKKEKIIKRRMAYENLMYVKMVLKMLFQLNRSIKLYNVLIKSANSSHHIPTAWRKTFNKGVRLSEIIGRYEPQAAHTAAFARTAIGKYNAFKYVCMYIYRLEHPLGSWLAHWLRAPQELAVATFLPTINHPRWAFSTHELLDGHCAMTRRLEMPGASRC